jgi:hypothetical protein
LNSALMVISRLVLVLFWLILKVGLKKHFTMLIALVCRKSNKKHTVLYKLKGQTQENNFIKSIKFKLIHQKVKNQNSGMVTS